MACLDMLGGQGQKLKPTVKADYKILKNLWRFRKNRRSGKFNPIPVSLDYLKSRKRYIKFIQS